MGSNYFKQSHPFKVPTIDGKTIEEHFGLASTQTREYSLAHMVAPPHWSEPHQTPEFDEITLMVAGKKQIEIDGKLIELKAGESLLVKKGCRVKYSNPYNEKAEYWALCMPAFSPDTVHREKP